MIVPVPTTRRILVVDDNQDSADLLSTLLTLRGHDTRVAHDGEEALAVAKAFSPHVIFLDIGLPGMDGYEIARMLRQDEQTSGVLLVALTGWGSPEDKRRTKEAGFDVHLIKPIETAALDEVLAR